MSWNWSKLFGGSKPNTRRRGRTLSLEAFEERFVPAGLSLTNGVLAIDGTQTGDTATTQIDAHGTATVLDDTFIVELKTKNFSQKEWFPLYASGTSRVTNFDNTNYSGVLAMLSDPRYFTGALSGGNKAMLMNGSFFKGPGGPANEMGGNILVGGPNYLASGIFAASKK